MLTVKLKRFASSQTDVSNVDQDGLKTQSSVDCSQLIREPSWRDKVATYGGIREKHDLQRLQK